jgi:hypothetical protein
MITLEIVNQRLRVPIPVSPAAGLKHWLSSLDKIDLPLLAQCPRVGYRGQ